MSEANVEFRYFVEKLLERVDTVLAIVRQSMDGFGRFHDLENKSERLQSAIEALLRLPHDDEISQAKSSHRRQQLQRRKQTIDAKLAELYIPFRDAQDEIRNFITAARDVLDCVPVDPPSLREIRTEIERLPVWRSALAQWPLQISPSYSDLQKLKTRLLEILASMPRKAEAATIPESPLRRGADNSGSPTEIERKEFGRFLQRTMDNRRDNKKSAAAKIGKGISRKALDNLLSGKPVKEFVWNAAHGYVDELSTGG